MTSNNNKVYRKAKSIKVPTPFLMVLVLFAFVSCNKKTNTQFFVRLLKQGWYLQSSDSLSASGHQISSASFVPKGWYKTIIPSTVLNSLVKQGFYKNIFVDSNFSKIPAAPFKNSWWYRKEFDLRVVPPVLLLNFKGINYKANIWLNGKEISDTSHIKNAFRQFKLDISKEARKGKNILAIEVFPPVAGDFSIGFVDWNPAPPDHNMGLFRGVSLEANGGVSITHPFVVSSIGKDLKQARLTVSLTLTNFKNTAVAGKVVLKTNGKKLEKPVSINAGETKEIIFTPDTYKDLQIKNPKLWWPHTLGAPHLYHATFQFCELGKILDEKSINYGIRTVSSYFTKEGFRGFKVNGKKILIRGGGWTDKILLNDTPEDIESQLEYVKNMNLNTIRLEGFWGNDQTLYSLCDKMGILIMAGWSCQWEWEDYLGKPADEKYGGILHPQEINLISKAWHDQILWLRNHPSIFAWFAGSDKIPVPALEKKYLQILSQIDSTRIFLASAKEWHSLSGPTGVKMRGPYAYEPPVYWFEDTLYGGAFGFNSETGPGAQVPPLESLEKMLSPANLWPINKMWNYHCGRHEFNTLDRYTKALQTRYGKIENVKDYTYKAQVMNYELMRPMFEAFSAYRYKATGVIQWMLNSAWPEMYWQLYDYYLQPNGAYYGAKKASQPWHVIYDYAHHAIFVVNDRLSDKKNCTLKISVFDNQSVLKFKKTLEVNLKANSSRKVLLLPKFKGNAPLYFLDTRLYDDSGKEIDNNFYWLSSKKDILDYKAKVHDWYYYTPSKQYADFTALDALPKVFVKTSLQKQKGNTFTKFTVTMTNTSNAIAFFLQTAIRDKKTGKTILPVLWSDNYISLLPGETKTLSAKIRNQYLEGRTARLSLQGYNLINKQ